MEVIQLLKKDHKMVKKMFEEFEGLSGRAAQKKPTLVEQIRQALTVHAQVEEELVYPAFKEHRALKALVCEAAEEHHVAKMLLSALEAVQPDDEQYDAKVKVLSEYVLHHVKEEEKELFPQAQKRLSTKQREALGEQVEARRSELMVEGDAIIGEGAEVGAEEGRESRRDKEAIEEEGAEGTDRKEKRPARHAA
jgi:hemerythrin superfamily protein